MVGHRPDHFASIWSPSSRCRRWCAGISQSAPASRGRLQRQECSRCRGHGDPLPQISGEPMMDFCFEYFLMSSSQHTATRWRGNKKAR